MPTAEQTIRETARELGATEYRRDSYRSALEQIVKLAERLAKHASETQGGLDGWNDAEADGAERCGEIARRALEE